MLVAFVRRFSKMSLKPLLFLWFNLLVCTFLFTSLPVGVAMSNASEDYTSLVFNGCSKQMFPNNAYPENLKSLMDSLVSSSSLKLFSAVTATSSDRTNGINGLYQCCGDLSPAECNTCVSKIPPLVSQLCGQTSVAARVQLGGCYLHYEIADLKPSDATAFLYKRCDDQAKAAGIGEKRDTAFGILENDVKNSTSPEVGGLYTSSYDTVNVSGQCEGTLANQLDCLTCLQSASQKARTECGDSISGQIYLYSCYISYSASSNASANGVPYSRKVAAGSGKNDSGSKTAAIVILMICIGAFILGTAVYYIRKFLNSG
ncbi:plasmodesmata-located protein 1-like [Argentina anserina]|uniref:plasmodesmata-located protein 1-like n=1 Tax=Argentina anserina TaxID=57926 RepID=UPI0021767B8F|nr:plasmodesmata-located protein 1-like [Potentilla anserina]